MKKKSKNTKKRKKKPSLFKRFFKILFSILSVYFIILIGFIGYVYFLDDEATSPIVENIVTAVAPKLPENTNVLIVGVDDEENRTDTIIIGNYNSVSNKANLISIPRDTLVKIPSDRWEKMVLNFPALSGNKSREIKINAINNYGQKQGIEFLKLQLEELLNISITYYAKVNLDAFKYLVDSIGGIEFNVPQRMYYSDPTQDLYIDLKPGLQTLDGDKAEQLVRFRGYTSADLERVQVQQSFIKEFLKKALSLDSILSNPTSYLNTLIEYVETDFKVSDAVKYIKALSSFDINNLETHTLPGTPEYINGASYYVTDELQISDFVYNIFEKPSNNKNVVLEKSFSKSIQVLNGSNTSGVASKTKNILESAGFLVSNIGDSEYQKSDKTKIYVSKEGEGKDLEVFFDDPAVIPNPNLVKKHGYDIVIIIGTEEAFKANEQNSNSS